MRPAEALGGGLGAVLVGLCLVHGAAPVPLPYRVLVARLGAAVVPTLIGAATARPLAAALAALALFEALGAPGAASAEATPG